jgi:hypothetical protein
MSYLRRLLRVELAAQIALCGCTVLLSAAFLAATLFICTIGDTNDSTLVVLEAWGMIAIVAYLYSVGPVALVIAPIYALLEARDRCSLVTVAAVGAVPGAATYVYSLTPYASASPSIAMSGACMATGASVAVGVYLVRTWRSENGSAA